MTYLLAFLGFAALIILHEFGHFLAAKAVGMRVERFSLFFGPLLVKFRRGETEYGIGPIPAGGYVRITGMNPHEQLPEEKELDGLRARREQLKADAALTERDSARNELDAIRGEVDAALAERDSAREELEEARAKRAHTKEKLAAATAERDSAREELKEAVTGRDNAQEALAAAVAGRENAQEELQSALTERDTALERVDFLRSERDAAQQQLETLRSEAAAAQEKVDYLRSERDGAQEQLETLRGEYDAARHELESLRSHHDAAQEQLEAARARLETAETRRTADESAEEKNRLRTKIERLEAQVSLVRQRAYYNQPVWKRVVVILAGPAVNLLIAFLIIWVIFVIQGEAIAHPNKQVAVVEKGTPAAAVLKPSDRIVSVDGVSGSVEKLQRQIRSHRCAGPQTDGCVAATPARVVVRRGQREETFLIFPRYVAKDGHMEVGFAFGVYYVQHPVTTSRAASLTVSGLWHVTTLTVSKFATLFEPQSRRDIHSVVGAFKVTQQRFGLSATRALETLALISLSLAVINLFPFLPLDGGHVFWAVAEKIRGKRIPVEVMERAGAVGFALILIIFVIGLSNDISTLTGPGFKVR